MYMALIRKESILSTHPQTAMDLGTHTKTYSTRSCPLAPEQGPEQERKHYRRKNLLKISQVIHFKYHCSQFHVHSSPLAE